MTQLAQLITPEQRVALGSFSSATRCSHASRHNNTSRSTSTTDPTAVVAVPRASTTAGSDAFMESEGFRWDILPSGHCRWRHLETGVTVAPRPEYTNEQWRDAKIHCVLRLYLVRNGVAEEIRRTRGRTRSPALRSHAVAYA